MNRDIKSYMDYIIEIGKLRTELQEANDEIARLKKVVDAANRWWASRTDYLIECEIALSTNAPIEGGTKYRCHAAASALAASDLVAALQELGQ